jgi:cation diffusion facilitator family transporter
MVAEGLHSVADTANQALLLVGMGLSVKENRERYPFGRAMETYFWAFIVALLLFTLGGAFAIYEGVHRLLEPPAEHGSVVVSVVVLVISLAIEGTSFSVAAREFAHSRRGRSVRATLFESRDPTIAIVLLEDSAAVVGLTVALAAVGISAATGNVIWDAIGSLVIGALLCGVGVVLAYETHGLLIGESATPEARARALDIVRSTPGVDAVTQMLTMHLGPDTVVLALKVRFRRDATIEDVERTTDAIEERVRVEMPEMKKIFVEADGHYDESLDPSVRPG